MYECVDPTEFRLYIKSGSGKVGEIKPIGIVTSIPEAAIIIPRGMSKYLGHVENWLKEKHSLLGLEILPATVKESVRYEKESDGYDCLIMDAPVRICGDDYSSNLKGKTINL